MSEVRMLESQPGAADESGNRAVVYEAGDVYTIGVTIPAFVADVFLREGWAEEVAAPVGPPETKPAAAPETKPARKRRTKRRSP